MDTSQFCEKKYLITNTIQELYDEYNRLQEVYNQNKCENELEKKSFILTIKKQEGEITNRETRINGLEEELSKKKIVINDYEKMIRDLEDKMNEILAEKEEENRFDMIRTQANEILAKEKEIIRLTDLLNKKDNIKDNKKDNKSDKNEKKILNVIESLESGISEEEDIVEISVKKIPEQDKEDNLKDIHSSDAIKPDKEEDLIYGENAADIAADRMAAHVADKSLEKDPDEGISEEEPENSEEEEPEKSEEEEEDYEILTYRKKEYWIKKGEDPQYVYEVLEEDGLGDKLGVFKKAPNGKMRVYLDKK